jgi:hypothetical protein
MLEAYDLIPIINCLKLPDQDAVNACFDNIPPWLSVTDGGDIAFSQGAINGFIGGSVGAVGTLIATLIKKDQVKDRLKCPYCDGTGIITCGICLGTSQLASVDAGTGTVTFSGCDTCESSGNVVCINCQGSGLNVPDEFVQVLGDSESGFSEDDYIGLFDEVKFPDRSDSGQHGLPSPAAPEPAVAAPAPAARSDAKEEVYDLTGGMG